MRPATNPGPTIMAISALSTAGALQQRNAALEQGEQIAAGGIAPNGERQHNGGRASFFAKAISPASAGS